ncbi:hypothetical protein DWV78_06180 [Agathobacter rectalis]|uniref:Uncharacterized protein n=1 Tax=Agathobacter rectalis TaxID=39491 RepID=A0A413BHU2_9FIRM|nr:hypothetical protein DWV78_06180 [Agathobacter rectalis]
MGDLELVGATLLTKPGNKGTHAIWPMMVMCFFSVMALFRIFLYAFSVSVNYPVLAAVGAAICVWFTFIFEYRLWPDIAFSSFFLASCCGALAFCLCRRLLRRAYYIPLIVLPVR